MVILPAYFRSSFPIGRGTSDVIKRITKLQLLYVRWRINWPDWKIRAALKTNEEAVLLTCLLSRPSCSSAAKPVKTSARIFQLLLFMHHLTTRKVTNFLTRSHDLSPRTNEEVSLVKYKKNTHTQIDFFYFFFQVCYLAFSSSFPDMPWQRFRDRRKNIKENDSFLNSQSLHYSNACFQNYMVLCPREIGFF